MRSMAHYLITGPCGCLGIVLRGSLIGGLVGGSLGGDLGGVLVSDGGLSPLGGWPVFDGGLSPLGGWPVFDGGLSTLGGLLGPIGIQIGLPMPIEGPVFSFGSLSLLFLISLLLLSFDAQGHGAAFPVGVLTPFGI